MDHGALGWRPDETAPAGGGAGEPSLADALARATPDGFALVSTDARLVATNDRLLDLWGLTDAERDEIRGLGRTAAAREALDRALATRTTGTFRVGETLDPDSVHVDELVLSDGRVIERYAAPVSGTGGRAGGRIEFHRDISRRRAIEDELRERARQQAALAAVGELAINVEETDPLLHAACATTAELMELDTVCLLDARDGTPVVRVAAGRAAPEPGQAFDAAALGFAGQKEIALPGREQPLRLLGAYARRPRAFTADESRFLEALASTLASALARRGAEQGLLERERETRAVFDGALDAMLLVADDGRVLDANGAACAFFASRREALLGRSLDLLAPAAPAGGHPAPPWTALLAGGRTTGERDLAAPADAARPGSPADAARPGSPAGAAAPGSPAGAAAAGSPAAPGSRVRSVEYAVVTAILPGRSLVVLRDVSERRQLSARLALADRMVSVGTLAAGVAHELNNPLAYVNANLVFLGDRLERLPALLAGAPATPADAELVAELQEAVRDARDGAERMRVIIRDLKTFSRGDEERTGPVELARVLESCLSMAWNEIRHRARLVKELAPVPPVVANEGRLGQVFLNLLVNAAQAIPEGRADEHRIRVSTATAPGERVAVEISDTGAGIPPEILPRIFDPFFTTKPPGVGTGLGLSICHSIVVSLGGEIQVETSAGRGATFRVLLPIAGAARAAAAGLETPRAAAAPRSRVLVVDDEPLIGNVLRRTLRVDHDVEVVASAQAALDRLAAGERYDAVVSDLLMPEMSGMDLHRALQAAYPALARRMVFLTGGAFTPAARAFLEREPVTCLEKPFELSALRAALARMLAGGG